MVAATRREQSATTTKAAKNVNVSATRPAMKGRRVIPP